MKSSLKTKLKEHWLPKHKTQSYKAIQNEYKAIFQEKGGWHLNFSKILFPYWSYL